MAGSLSDFRYETDTGLVFAIRADDSNTMAVNAGLTSAQLRAPAGTVVLPVATRCRKAIYRSDDNRHTVAVPVLAPGALANIPATLTVKFAPGPSGNAAVDVVLRAKRPRAEKFGRSSAGDTGQTV